MHKDYSDEDHNSVCFVGQKTYSVQTCHLFYTTYDLQQNSDTINPQMHPDIMLRSPETKEGAEAYWYARVIGVYHANVWVERTDIPDPWRVKRMDFLWVRWFGRDLDYKAGWKAKRLHRLGFLSEDRGPFGFLDPNEVIRGVHLIPTFAYGRTSDILGPSIARQPHENDEDWTFYYVNPYVKPIKHYDYN